MKDVNTRTCFMVLSPLEAAQFAVSSLIPTSVEIGISLLIPAYIRAANIQSLRRKMS